MELLFTNKLKKYINEDGMILLNENTVLPNLDNYGGKWDHIMELIEEREVFFSKFFRKRTTYLSQEMYFNLKIFKQKIVLNEVEYAIFNLLNESEGADTEFIKNTLHLEKKVFNQAMDRLLANLLVTVLRRGKNLNDNWSTLIWGTYLQWEDGRSCSTGTIEECREYVYQKLEAFLSKRQIDSLLR